MGGSGWFGNRNPVVIRVGYVIPIRAGTLYFIIHERMEKETATCNGNWVAWLVQVFYEDDGGLGCKRILVAPPPASSALVQVS